MSCNAEAENSPSWLKVTSSVQSSAGNCNVQTNGADEHLVWAENISGLPYIIEIDSTCTTQFVRYMGDFEHDPPSAGWKTSFNVPICPGWRPKEGAGRAAKLASVGPANHQEIVATLTWKVEGDILASNHATLPVHVTTL